MNGKIALPEMCNKYPNGVNKFTEIGDDLLLPDTDYFRIMLAKS